MGNVKDSTNRCIQVTHVFQVFVNVSSDSKTRQVVSLRKVQLDPIPEVKKTLNAIAVARAIPPETPDQWVENFLGRGDQMVKTIVIGVQKHPGNREELIIYSLPAHLPSSRLEYDVYGDVLEQLAAEVELEVRVPNV